MDVCLAEDEGKPEVAPSAAEASSSRDQVKPIKSKASVNSLPSAALINDQTYCTIELLFEDV